MMWVFAIAALIASTSVGMIFGVGFYRAGQVRAMEEAERHLYRASNVMEAILQDNNALTEKVMELHAVINTYETYDLADNHDGITVDTPSTPLSEIEYERFWSQIEGEDK
jgi:hypothetical protein